MRAPQDGSHRRRAAFCSAAAGGVFGGQDDRVGGDPRPFLESTGLPRGEGLALFLWGVGVRGFLAKKERSRTDQIWASPPGGLSNY